MTITSATGLSRVGCSSSPSPCTPGSTGQRTSHHLESQRTGHERRLVGRGDDFQPSNGTRGSAAPMILASRCAVRLHRFVVLFRRRGIAMPERLRGRRSTRRSAAAEICRCRRPSARPGPLDRKRLRAGEWFAGRAHRATPHEEANAHHAQVCNRSEKSCHRNHRSTIAHGLVYHDGQPTAARA